jgi:hypothetical protein
VMLLTGRDLLAAILQLRLVCGQFRKLEDLSHYRTRVHLCCSSTPYYQCLETFRIALKVPVARFEFRQYFKKKRTEGSTRVK